MKRQKDAAAVVVNAGTKQKLPKGEKENKKQQHEEAVEVEEISFFFFPLLLLCDRFLPFLPHHQSKLNYSLGVIGGGVFAHERIEFVRR